MSLNKPIYKLKDWININKLNWNNLSLNSNAIKLLKEIQKRLNKNAIKLLKEIQKK